MTTASDLPSVTVQLPVFNESNVVARLVRAACALDYPQDRLEIQVLDDSTDDTTPIAAEIVDEYQRQGCPITHIHRNHRDGFKAGALANGLFHSRGEIVAIFDADFVPPPDFLRDTVSAFEDQAIGMVQARWTHLNRDRSLLTQVQAHLLDAHFLIEHDARYRSNRFFNFNGTAGLWRRSAITDAGGWEGDTLTEDLDLSYRAQLRGWRFVFLPTVSAPAELPEHITAFKSQQRRWAKGSIQTARKLLPRILRADLPLCVKAEAFFHLTANLAYPLMVVLALLLLPNLIYRFELGWSMRWIVLADAAAILGATASLAVFYFEASRRALGSGFSALLRLPAIMALGIGISLSNTIAVAQGLFGSRGTFVRTPKSGSARHSQIAFYSAPRDFTALLELVLALICAASVGSAATLGVWGSIPFLILFPAGFFAVSMGSLAGPRS